MVKKISNKLSKNEDDPEIDIPVLPDDGNDSENEIEIELSKKYIIF